MKSKDQYAHLTTEQPNPDSEFLDRLTPLEFVDLMQREEQWVLAALEKVRVELAGTIGILADRFSMGGRLFYVGAGTSGRLGMLDAAECPPTFGVPHEQVQAILAGGFECLVRSVEGAEDDLAAGGQAVLDRGVTSKDFVLGIAASSTTPFVRGALQTLSLGAHAVLLTCHEGAVANFDLDRLVILPTGPEVLTGSTRLKAGTATKLFINRLTTGAMVQSGKVYRNRMVDLYLTCDKLRERAIRTTRFFTGLERDEAIQLLERSNQSVKQAILVHRLGITPKDAAEQIQKAGGNLRLALGE